MKTKTLLLICILCFAVLIILGSCATMKSPDKLTYERFCGTWVNDKYGGGESFVGARWIFNPDGTFLVYVEALETGIAGTPNFGNYTVDKRWIDSEGHSWYNIIISPAIAEFGTQYVLGKLNKYNTVLEGAISNNDFPAEINKADKHSTYVIFYRF